MSEAPDSMDFRPLGELLCPELEERPDLWSWSVCRWEDGVLEIGGVTLSGVTQESATPLFVLGRVNLHGRANVWAAVMVEGFWGGYGMNGDNTFYAGKALLCSDVVRTVGEVGVGIDTTLLSEFTMAVHSGMEPLRIGLYGNNKLDSETEPALRAGGGKGIERIFVDSLPEIAQIEAIAMCLSASVRVMIRVKTGVHAREDGYASTRHEDQKFGAGAFDGQLEEVVTAIGAASHLEFRGLHSHIGSQIRGTAAFEEAASIIYSLGKKISEMIGRLIEEIDLGGGVGVAYTGDNESPTPPVETVRQITRSVREACIRLDMKVSRISIESERSIAGPSTVTPYRVGIIKDANLAEGFTRRYVAVDGGMADNIRPALYGVCHTATLANRVPDAELVRSQAASERCKSGDAVVWDVDLPSDVRTGDLLAVPATSAYGYSMASSYNMPTKPDVVAVEDGTVEWAMRPQTVEDLFALDPGLD